jgi:hypothetical protein
MLIYDSYFLKFDSSNRFFVVVGKTCATFLLRWTGHAILHGGHKKHA